MERCFSISRAACWAAVVVATLGPLAGCALWNSERWNLDRFRDERAVDIEGRLARDMPIVENPF